MFRTRPEWVVLQLGAALAGLVLVTVNPALRRGELAYVLRQFRSAGMFHSEVNGFIIVRLQVNAFIATLGMATIVARSRRS